MHTFTRSGRSDSRCEIGRCGDMMTMSTECGCQHHEVRIREIESVISKSAMLLFPLDHTVGVIIEDDDDEIQSE